jgi:hypothetical protein
MRGARRVDGFEGTLNPMNPYRTSRTGLSRLKKQ